MRYRAWLDATPGKAKRSRYAQLKAREDEAPELELPEVPEAVGHVVDYLFEVGPATGEHEVSWCELAAWCGATGTVLDAWESAAVRSLSAAYLSMRLEAADPKCPAPVLRVEALPSREAVAKGLGELLRSFNRPEVKAAIAKRKAADE